MSAQNDLPFEHEVAETILVAHAALEKAAQAYQETTEKQAACNAVIPSLVDLAVKTAAIESDERDAFAQALTDPLKTLQLFKFALEQRWSQSNVPGREVDSTGRAPQEKKASTYGRGNPFVGSGAGLAAANAAFDDAMGIN